MSKKIAYVTGGMGGIGAQPARGKAGMPGRKRILAALTRLAVAAEDAQLLAVERHFLERPVDRGIARRAEDVGVEHRRGPALALALVEGPGAEGIDDRGVGDRPQVVGVGELAGQVVAADGIVMPRFCSSSRKSMVAVPSCTSPTLCCFPV